MLTDGNEIPMKKPRTTPITVTITILMVSFVNLNTLRALTCHAKSKWGNINCRGSVQPIGIRSGAWKRYTPATDSWEFRHDPVQERNHRGWTVASEDCYSSSRDHADGVAPHHTQNKMKACRKRNGKPMVRDAKEYKKVTLQICMTCAWWTNDQPEHIIFFFQDRQPEHIIFPFFKTDNQNIL